MAYGCNGSERVPNRGNFCFRADKVPTWMLQNRNGFNE